MKHTAKTISKKLIPLFLLGVFIFASGSQDTQAATKVTRIQWSNVKSSKLVYRGQTVSFQTKITPTKAKSSKLVWSSGNKKIATVTSSGKVKGIKNGVTYITCKVKAQPSKKVSCRVTVRTQKVTKVKFSKSSASVQKGKTYTQTAVATPTYAYNRGVTYKSSNTSVATVTSAGKVTGKKEGTVTITATAKDGSKKKGTYKVRVIAAIKSNSAKFVAHRGLSSKAPENTVKAYRLAGQSGFWGCETDIRMTKDGEFIAMHDSTLKRMCGVNKKPEDLTLAEIRKLPIKAGNGYNTYKSDSTATTIPTLKEYLQVCKDYGMVPIVELKMEYTKGNTKTYTSFQDMVKADMKELYNQTKAVMGSLDFQYIGYDLETIVQMRDVLNLDNRINVSLQHVTSNPSTAMRNYYVNRDIILDAKYTEITASEIQTFRNYGVPVNVWTVDDQAKVADYIKVKVDYITTNKTFW